MAAKDVSREEIKEALKVIVKVCKNQFCEDCPFLRKEDDKCYMRGVKAPVNWELNDSEGIWRAFK